MTITYLDGTVVQAVALSHDDNEIRAIAPGCDDVLAFSRVRDRWVSDEIDPVAIDFELQQRPARPVLSEEDCVCSKDLAARLIQTFFAGSDLQSCTPPILVFNSDATLPRCDPNFKSTKHWTC